MHIEVIKTISRMLFFFLTKRFRAHKNTSHLEVYARVKNCCLCCLILAYFCFVSWFLLVTCFCTRETFSSKKNKQAWKRLDNLNIQHYLGGVIFITTLSLFHLFRNNTQKSKMFLLWISSGNLSASGVVTCQYPQSSNLLKKVL